MLLRFAVTNHRSIMDQVELSMIAVDEDRPATRGFDLLSERVLTVAGIYGANASGKSNVLEALAWLSTAVGDSLRAWDEFVPREPFKFGEGPTTGSAFEVEMIVDGIRYEYHLELDDSAVLFEALYSYPERRRRELFVRNRMDIKFRRGLSGSAGTKELLTPTTLALSAATRLEDEEIRDCGRAIRAIATLGFRRGTRGGWRPPPSTLRMFRYPGPSDDRESAFALLRFADFGIDDLRLIEETRSGANGAMVTKHQVQFMHRVGGELVAFNFGEESAGTRTWFELIGPVLNALKEGHVLLFDEIDASLHPRLSARLLELFQDPETNPHGAQLIFATHDTSLLNHLNRDEVWLTEKGAGGATTLTALAEFGGDKVRKSLNLEKAYLQGRFGAVPDLDQAELRRVLGVAGAGD